MHSPNEHAGLYDQGVTVQPGNRAKIGGYALQNLPGATIRRQPKKDIGLPGDGQGLVEFIAGEGLLTDALQFTQGRFFGLFPDMEDQVILSILVQYLIEGIAKIGVDGPGDALGKGGAQQDCDHQQKCQVFIKSISKKIEHYPSSSPSAFIITCL